MIRSSRSASGLDPDILNLLVAHGEDTPDIDERVLAARTMCGRSHERAELTLRFVIENLLSAHGGMRQLQSNLGELEKIAQGLLDPPWYPAVFVRHVDRASSGGRVLVWQGGTYRVVQLAEAVDQDRLRAGDEVYLGSEMNVVVDHSPGVLPRCGETAVFERLERDGRLVVRWRDEEIVIEAADTLRPAELNKGDQVRWQRETWMAFERMKGSAGQRYLLEETPEIDRTAIGGHDEVVDELLGALTATLVKPDTARRYLYGTRQSILLCGPPGCGKTSLARFAAAEISRLSGTKCLFGVVKPSEWEAPHVGETQQNIRQCFQALAEQARDSMAVLFLDEVETVGRLRGSISGHHSDKFLAALLAELDGFSSRAGIAVIAATNRKDLVDPALLERLSDLELKVERPGIEAAREIVSIHLPETLPFHPNGSVARDTREQVIETALSRLYGPNSPNELCRLRFRDGSSRTVTTRELVSGRLLEQLCRATCRHALWRDIRGGGVGIQVADVEEACATTIDRLGSTLSLHNVGAYLDDLPQDLDVVAVEASTRIPTHPSIYLHS